MPSPTSGTASSHFQLSPFALKTLEGLVEESRGIGPNADKVNVATLRQKLNELPADEPARAAGFRMLADAYTEVVKETRYEYPVWETGKYEVRRKTERTQVASEFLEYSSLNAAVKEALFFTENATPELIQGLAVEFAQHSRLPLSTEIFVAALGSQGMGDWLDASAREMRGLNSFKTTIPAFARIAAQYAETPKGIEALSHFYVANMSRSIDAAKSFKQQDVGTYGTEHAHVDAAKAQKAQLFGKLLSDTSILKWINKSVMAEASSFRSLDEFVTWAQTQKNEIVNETLGNLVDRFGASSVGA